MSKLVKVGMQSAVLAVFVMAVCALMCFPQTARAEVSSTGELQAEKKSGLSIVDTPTETPADIAFKKSTAKLKVDRSKGWLVDDGTYFMVSAKDATVVIGGNGQVEEKSGASRQAWKLKFDYNSQTYTIVNVKTGKALTAKKSATKNSKLYESRLVKAKQHLTQLKAISAFTIPVPNQRWVLQSDGNGYYLASAVNKTMVVDISGRQAKLVKNTAKSKNAYLWFIEKTGTYDENGIGGGIFTLTSKANKKFLNINGSSVKASAKAKASKAKTLWGEMFDFQYVGNGYYKIVNFNSGMLLTGKSGQVYQAAYKSSLKNNQLWRPEIVGKDGAIQLVNKQTDKALAVSGQNVTLEGSDSESVEQRWYINPTSAGLTTVGRGALYRANKWSSKTKRAIVIDMTAHEYFLFKKAKASQSGAPWVLDDTSRCSTGKKNSRGKSITWAGVNETGSYPGHVSGVPAKYCLWAGHGSWIHSIVTYGPQGDNQMGWYISLGCIRLPYNKAKYVYDLKERGTRLIRYYTK